MKSKRILLLLIAFVFAGNISLFAHEGMWIPSMIKTFLSDMQADGLKLSAEEIYAINKSSQKDAIVHFGGGCTAEVVSSQGLILTNHHCGFSQIQTHSSVDKDYLKDGFWAMDKSQELTNPGLTATFIVRIEDVTKKILDGLTDDMDPANRAQRIQSRIAEMEKMVQEAEPGHSAEIKPFYYGNEYYLIVKKTYRDVRLVGAPPSSIGKYGGDTDNWMWPRHTGDFSVFRVYAGPDNQPADISEDNVPYKPGHHFPVTVKGTKPGEFTMVYGFPGTTQQYLHSSAIKYITQTMNPRAIKMREQSLAIIDKAMASSDEIRIQYAAKQARIANAWKKWIGENRGLERLDAIAKKEAAENEFRRRVNAKPELKEQYGGLLDELERHNGKGQQLMTARSMLIEMFYMGPEFIRHAQAYQRLVENYEELEEKGEVDKYVEGRRNGMPGHFKNYQPMVDQQALAALWPMYIEALAPEYRPDVQAELVAEFGNDWDRMAKELFEDSYFVDPEREKALLDKFNKGAVKKVKKDWGYKIAVSVLEAWTKQAGREYFEWEAKTEELMRLYVKGMKEVFPDKTYWPDANSTLRIAWGKLGGSEPADGVIYNPYTTLQGVIEKYIPGDREFDLPPRILELYRQKDYGIYANAEGKLPVCFTAANHTTGGNSGSPVLNGEGHLIGINFDRSWESTMSDIMYDPEYCRNITVDIRYVLFIIDKYAGAGHLVEEMTVVK